MSFFFNFEDRHQLFKIKECNCTLIKNHYGVPKGSVLRPTRSNIYLNALGFIPFQSRLLQYVDGTALVLSHSNYEKAVSVFQNDIDSL